MVREIGGYRLGDPLGEGGAGVVFRATQPGLGRAVALKVLREVFRHTVDELRFQREVRVATRLSHPALVRLLDGGVDGDRQYLVMELVEGRDLHAVLPRGAALPWRLAAAIAARVADGLAAMHAAGIVHRDVKAGNVLLSRLGEVKLGDFGLARPFDATAVTRAGDIVGTLEVMAPEVLSGDAATPPSDLWSLGCLLYRMLTGRSHIPIEPAADWHSRVLTAPILPPGRHAADLPADLALLTMSLLDRTPARRPTAPAAHHALTALLDSGDDLLTAHIPALVDGRAPIPPPRASAPVMPDRTECLAPPPPSPRRWPLALATLTALLLLSRPLLHPPPAPSHRSPAAPTSTSTSTPTPTPTPTPTSTTSLFPQWRRIAHLTARLEADTKSNRGSADAARARVDVDLGPGAHRWLHWIRLGRFLDSTGTTPPRYPETATVVVLDLDVERSIRASQRTLPSDRLSPESLAHLLQAVGLGPDEARTWLSLGHALALDGARRESARCLELGMARLGSSPLGAKAHLVTWLGLLRALVLQGDPERARTFWRHARYGAANNPMVWSAVERAATIADRLDEELLTAALDYPAAAPQGLDWLLPRLEQSRRDPGLAQAAIRRALATAPDDPHIRQTVERHSRD